MNNMKEVALLFFLLVNSFVFFLGANTAKNKRGRYLDKPIYEFVPDIIIKIAISMMGIIIYSYLVWKNRDSLSKLFIIIFALFYIAIIIASFFKQIKKYTNIFRNNHSEKGKNEETTEKIEPADTTETTKITSNAMKENTDKEIIAISDTALCNGSLATLIIMSFLILFIFLNKETIGVDSLLLLDYLNALGIGNVFFMLLFNSLILQTFSILKFIRFVETSTASKDSNDIGKIIRFLKDDVES